MPFAPTINPAQMEHGYRRHVDESRNIRGLTSNGAWNANRTKANQKGEQAANLLREAAAKDEMKTEEKWATI